ncbi:MAG TPA: hypothetical protein VGU01_06880 [Sphingomicrobium sp.]|nr:hypothetical protein [Sphingomicrobium sp.]
MSRTLYLKLDEDKVLARCLKEQVGVSALERLPGGGVRLVCKSSEGAERIRLLLRTQLLDDKGVERKPHRPNTPLW